MFEEMRRITLFLAVCCAAIGMQAQRMNVIFETDMGNDVDDALAIDMLYKYNRQGRINLMAVMLNKEGEFPPKYIDLLNTSSDVQFRPHDFLNVFFGDAMIERFSGDGILVSTPAGSTAYNYSIGGSIVDPHLELLQMTPIAPMNTTVYRSFTSSLILPSNQLLTLIPDMRQDPYINIQSDGFIREFNDVKKITIGYSTKKIHLVKFSGYEFWTKVKEKFLIGNADGSTEQDLK